MCGTYSRRMTFGTALSDVDYGIRYEYFSPFRRSITILAELATMLDLRRRARVVPDARLSFAAVIRYAGVPVSHGVLHREPASLCGLPESTVVRAGYVSTTRMEVCSLTTLAHQPPFANVQTNEVTTRR